MPLQTAAATHSPFQHRLQPHLPTPVLPPFSVFCEKSLSNSDSLATSNILPLEDGLDLTNGSTGSVNASQQPGLQYEDKQLPSSQGFQSIDYYTKDISPQDTMLQHHSRESVLGRTGCATLTSGDVHSRTTLPSYQDLTALPLPHLHRESAQPLARPSLSVQLRPDVPFLSCANETSMPCSGLKRKRDMGSSLSETESQQFILLLPGAEAIDLDVDYSKASNLAAKKRAMNAVASRRCREKAAEREHDAQELQWFRENWQTMEAMNRNMEQQLNTYRRKLDYLKSMVEQQPSTNDFSVRLLSPTNPPTSPLTDTESAILLPLVS
ncbi:hypothetical protein FSARC_1864 [Fusarium sarcochroum]|uniref:BZIP domain-containing protein n=1 Tax=Fusarium sarcochroum TaxID=1208366 RepID=A0A8H4U7L4_9HYPO|nr:hypothetical protein FSARC_1864 [Fusarium sarcochroum]